MRDVNVLDLPVIYTGSLQECEQYCKDRRYSFLRDNTPYGGHYADAITGTSSKGAYHAFFFLSIAGLIYLVLTTLSNLAFMALEQRYSVGIRKPEL